MSNLITGQKSFQHSFAQFLNFKSLSIALCALCLALLPFGAFGSHAKCQPLDDACPSSGAWSVTLDLAQPVSPGATITFREIDPGAAQSMGLTFKGELSLDGAALTCHLTASISHLPPNKALGVVTVHDAGGHQSYLISSDDGGIMIIIDEF